MTVSKTKKVLFFSSVSDIELFNRTGFYRVDISALELSGHSVIKTNQITAALQFWKYDVMFAYFWKKSFVPAAIARLLGKRVVFTGGADELDKQFISSRVKYLVHALAFFCCHFVSHICLVGSHSDLSNMSLILGGSRKLRYSPLPLPLADTLPGFVNSPRKRCLISIVWMATLANTQRKGLDTAIEVLSELRKKDPDYELLIIGTEGEGSVYLREIAKKFGQETKVRILGAVSEEKKVEMLLTSQFYIQLSKYEGFGLAVLEAMACGAVVVHSNRGGLADTAGDSGIVAPLEKSPREIAEQILVVAKDQVAYEKYQNLARQKVATFNLKRRMAEIESAIFDL